LAGFKRYEYAVSKTKGIYIDIKSDFNKVLGSISTQMVDVSQSFALTHIPINPSSLKVIYNGIETKDYVYATGSNTIKPGKSIPDGVNVEVEYEIEEL
jgi:hypothetical protein